jgi:excisionase family DNA binding protein
MSSVTIILNCEVGMGKVFITQKELAEQMGVSEKTLNELIRKGDLPDYSYGNRESRKKGWHTSVLEKHALERYDRSLSIKNASNIEVGTEDMTVMPLSRSNTFMTTEKADLDDGNPSQKKLGRKKMPKSMSTPFNAYLLNGF